MKKISVCDESVLYKRHPDFLNLMCGSNGMVYSLNVNRFIFGRDSHNGYKRTLFGHQGKKLSRATHRLICETFIGKSNLTVNHINGDKVDNRITNLEYATSKENILHAVRNGLIKTGNSSGLTKIKLHQREEIRAHRSLGKTYREIGEIYGVTATIACAICRRKDRMSIRDGV